MPEAIERAPSKFNLPVDLTQELARRVPSGQRSRFVAKAIEQALQEDARTHVLALIDNPPLHDTKGQDSVEAHCDRCARNGLPPIIARFRNDAGD